MLSVKVSEKCPKEWKKLFEKWDMVKISGLGVERVIKDITELLVKEERWRDLELFFSDIRKYFPNIFDDLCKTETFSLNMIAYYRHMKDYQNAYRLIRQGVFRDLDTMLELWDQLHYEEKSAGIKMSSVMKYRIRQRNPPPLSICPTGKRPTFSFSKRTKVILNDWFDKRRSNPYPTRREKIHLCQQTGLTLQQVQTWFANARRRHNLAKRRNINRPKSVNVREADTTSFTIYNRKDIANRESAAIEGMLALHETVGHFATNMVLPHEITYYEERCQNQRSPNYGALVRPAHSRIGDLLKQCDDKRYQILQPVKLNPDAPQTTFICCSNSVTDSPCNGFIISATNANGNHQREFSSTAEHLLEASSQEESTRYLQNEQNQSFIIFQQ